MIAASITDDIASPAWWMSVVIAGLLVNLLAAYLKSPVDRLLSHSSSRWRASSEKRREKRNQLIERLRQDADFKATMLAWEFRLRMNTVLSVAIISVMLHFLVYQPLPHTWIKLLVQ